MATEKLLPLTDTEGQKAEGIPFQTVSQARWAHRKRHENGLAGAFVTIGRRVYIDVPRFHELAGRNRA